MAAAFWIFRVVSVQECPRLMKNLMQVCCSTRSVTLNVTATQYTCSLNSVYHPHWLVQWSHNSRMCILVHSPWLSGYINVRQTILIILTKAGLFPNRPHIHIYETLSKSLACPHSLMHPFNILNSNYIQMLNIQIEKDMCFAGFQTWVWILIVCLIPAIRRVNYLCFCHQFPYL